MNYTNRITRDMEASKYNTLRATWILVLDRETRPKINGIFSFIPTFSSSLTVLKCVDMIILQLYLTTNRRNILTVVTLTVTNWRVHTILIDRGAYSAVLMNIHRWGYYFLQILWFLAIEEYFSSSLILRKFSLKILNIHWRTLLNVCL